MSNEDQKSNAETEQSEVSTSDLLGSMAVATIDEIRKHLKAGATIKAQNPKGPILEIDLENQRVEGGLEIIYPNSQLTGDERSPV